MKLKIIVTLRRGVHDPEATQIVRALRESLGYSKVAGLVSSRVFHLDIPTLERAEAEQMAHELKKAEFFHRSVIHDVAFEME
jgi:phosphoribosylformylglycinamidine synthase PurS subunit